MEEDERRRVMANHDDMQPVLSASVVTQHCRASGLMFARTSNFQLP